MKRIYNVVIIDDDQASIDNLVACLNSFQMLEIAGTDIWVRKSSLKTNPIYYSWTWN